MPSNSRAIVVQLPSVESARLLHRLLIDGRFEEIKERRNAIDRGMPSAGYNWAVREIERILRSLDDSMKEAGCEL
jgi:hypothetical protein